MSSDFTPGPLLSFDLVGENAPPPRPYVNPNLPTRRLFKPVPEEPDCYYLTVDNSTLEYSLKCTRASEYYAVRSREPDRSAAALVFGGAIHKGVEVLMRYGVNEASIHRGKGLIFEHFEQRPVAIDEWRTADHAIKVFNKYAQKYPLELWNVATNLEGQPLVEIPFAIPLGAVDIDDFISYPHGLVVAQDDAITWKPRLRPDGKSGFFIKKVYILWSGRMDAIITWDGKFWVMDHKTTSIGGKGFFNDFILSMQTTGYAWAGRRIIQQPVEGLVLNAIIARKPTPTGKWLELERRRYSYSDDHLAEWEDDVLALIADFLASLKRGYFPKKTAWCQGKYGQCKYHDVCVLPRAQRGIMLNSNLFRNVTWNPLHIDDPMEAME